ncbi:hypothetical protein MQC88_02665 [Luteimonas sp. 50]|uniref:Uncharacterized protein n=1 Tax=Cognatiluteimonas sedimenti TaxID=2927791 RepID=A0ABT0A1L3_9GAMM|nr:hypothetical protein [Lysobacter sedimenti]MCJ0824869.1 hypothetical protein [Lysobacter sedimenti]
MLNSIEVEAILKEHGFSLASADSRRYAHGFRHGGLGDPLYVKAKTAKTGTPVAVGRYPLVVHPLNAPLTRLSALPGVHMAPSPYHNTNLADFPKRDNGGKKEIAHGRAFQFADRVALDAFVDAVLS